MNGIEGTSARVSGHTLRYEGAAYRSDGMPERRHNGWGHGKCSCGELSGALANTAERKRWHRRHKAEVLAAKEQS